MNELFLKLVIAHAQYLRGHDDCCVEEYHLLSEATEEELYEAREMAEQFPSFFHAADISQELIFRDKEKAGFFDNQ